jgi:serine/threonine protein kinase/DNA-binding beta-propeller fold protein YncE
VSDQTPGTPGEFSGSGEFGVGSQIAGYRLEERIGRGGMAVVFRAYDARLDRQVALKILAPGLAEDDAFRQRFIRESRAAAAVDDPHITPVFEAGEANGVLFIAMRYVRGGDVRSLIDRLGPLPLERAAEIVSQVASALDAAHARGLVHRDVKPANMLLEASSTPDRPDHVYLSDFGLSKTSLAVSGLTATGQFLGTLDYVAPEQIEGHQLDGRTDVYALACSTFEMLTGEPPFRRDQGMSVMFAHLSEPPPAARQRRPDLPPGIDRVITKALAKAPADRYPTCREFAAELRHLAGVARPDSPPASHPVTQVARPPITSDPAPRLGPPRRDPAGDVPAPAQTQASGYRPPPRTEVTDPAAGLAAAGRAAADHLSTSGTSHTNGAGGTGDTGGGLAADFQAGATSQWAHSEQPSRRRRGRRLPIAAACVVVLLVGGSAYELSRPGPAAPHTGNSPHATSAALLTLPKCTTATAKAATLSHVTTEVAAIGGNPFGVVVTADGQYSFVTAGDAIDLMHNGTSLAPTLVRSIAAPGADKGAALTSDGKFLVAAAGSGAVVVDVAQAEQGAPDPVLGRLTSPNGSGAVEVLITADNQFAFVTLQNSAEMAVFNLRQALAQGISPSDFIGYVPLGDQPVGIATDGTWLYVTDFGGHLNVVSMSRAETDPAHAVVARAPAGCQPARAVISPDHQVIWVTARGSDALLGFSAAKLRTDPGHALVARVMVGEVPLGETLVDHGARIVVADSNLNGLAGVPYNVAVISTADALSGKPALLGYVPTGSVPRQFAVVPGGATLLVTVQGAHELEAIKAGDLP